MPGAQGFGARDDAHGGEIRLVSALLHAVGAALFAGAMIFIEFPVLVPAAIAVVALYYAAVRTIRGRWMLLLSAMPLVFGVTFWIWLLTGTWDCAGSSCGTVGRSAGIAMSLSGALVIGGGLLAPLFLALALVRSRRAP